MNSTVTRPGELWIRRHVQTPVLPPDLGPEAAGPDARPVLRRCVATSSGGGHGDAGCLGLRFDCSRGANVPDERRDDDG